MKVQVVTYSYIGLMEDPVVFSTERKARNFIKKMFGEQGIKYLELIDCKIDPYEYYEVYDFNSDYEIHLYEVSIQ